MIDKVKKIIYIIVGALTIMSLVFSLAKKIGYCASSEQTNPYYDDYPLPIGENIGGEINFTQADINAINTLLNDNVYYMLMYEITDSNHYVLSVFYHSEPLVTYSYHNNYGFARANVTFTGTEQAVRIDAINHTASFFGSGINANYILYNYQVLESSPVPDFYAVKSGYIKHYPVYSVYDNTITSGDKVLFQPLTSSENIPSGHSKGGVLANYIESDQMIENSSDLPEVDTTPPDDPNNNAAWYQKILNAIKRVNQSIQSGVLTIGDYIGAGVEKIAGLIEQIIQMLGEFFAWVTEPPDIDTILDNVTPYLADNDLVQGFLSTKDSISGVFTSLEGVSSKSSSDLVWDIPFNLPSMSTQFHAIIDFGWYENIRNKVEPYLNMILAIGFLFSFIRSIPGILHGNSGEGDT